MKQRHKSTFNRRVGALALGLGLCLAGCSPKRDLSPVPSTFNGGSFEPTKPQAGQPFTIADLALEMQPISAGTFLMGSPGNEPGRGANEGPQTVVTISRPFWLGRTPVTHGQWKALMGTDLTGQAQKASASDNDFIQLLARCDDATAMYFVNWHEAMAFCERLNARARAEGSLPAGYEFTLPQTPTRNTPTMGITATITMTTIMTTTTSTVTTTAADMVMRAATMSTAKAGPGP